MMMQLLHSDFTAWSPGQWFYGSGVNVSARSNSFNSASVTGHLFHTATLACICACRYGFGVGGEYPMASASAAERSQADDALRHRRGEQVVMVFSGQVRGVVWNSGGGGGGKRVRKGTESAVAGLPLLMFCTHTHICMHAYAPQSVLG